MLLFFLFFKQKTAYEMRISDWSSDVCSSDLHLAAVEREAIEVIPEIGHVEADIEVVQPVGQLYVAAVGVVGIAGGQAGADGDPVAGGPRGAEAATHLHAGAVASVVVRPVSLRAEAEVDRKSTRLNSSH